MDNRDTGNIGHTRHRRKTNKTEGANQEWTTETLVILGTQDTEGSQIKQKVQIKNGQHRDTGNIGHTRHRRKTNKTEGANQEWTTETLVILGTQDTGGRQTKQKVQIKNGQQRHW